MNAEREWAESSVLSALLERPESYRSFELTADHFSIQAYRQIYQAIGHHVDHGFPVDLVTIGQTLEAQGRAKAADLLTDVAAAPNANADSHAEAIRWSSETELARGIARELIKTGDVATAMQRLHALQHGRARYLHRDTELRKRFFEGLDSETAPGLKTGFQRIDAVLGGFHPGDLTVIGARPRMGKTALALNMAASIQAPFLFVSGEQPAIECEARMLASAAMVPAVDIRNRRLSQDQHEALRRAAERPRAPYWIFDRSAPSLAEIWSQARRAQHEIGIKALFVDYIQRLRRDPKKPKHEAVGDNIMGLKELARDLEIPVIVLAQVNRGVDERPDDSRIPGISDLKDSGEIEQEADVVMTLYRKRAYHPTLPDFSAVLSVCKNRHGPTGLVTLEYLEQFVTFQDGRGYV